MDRIVLPNGTTFKSAAEACRELDIDYHTFKYRMTHGYTIEEALSSDRATKNMKRGPNSYASKKCMDHLGNSYDSQKEMCAAYRISLTNFIHRLERGWSLEEALSPATYKKRHLPDVRKGYEVEDHLGNVHSSVMAMCKAYGINCGTYNSRRKRGWSLEKALTAPLKDNGFKCEDHLGNQYSSLREMCKAYDVSLPLYLDRKKRNWSTEDALTLSSRMHGNKTA